MAPEFGNLAEVITLITETQGRLDTSWTLFLSINSAIIGGVVLIEHTFNIIEKSVVITIYTALTLLNYLVTHNIINQLSALYKDVEKLKYLPDQAGYEIASYFTNIVNGDAFWASPWLIPTVYISVYIFTILCVVFDEKITFSKKTLVK